MAKEKDEQTAPQMMALPVEQMAMLIASIDKLFERIDQNRDDDASRSALTEILATHGAALKSALKPENALHPDVSFYNPDGERDHPRPRLRRPVYFLGLPIQPETLTKPEILALNNFNESLEIAEKKWQGRILKDAAGTEILYISVPFRSFDDLRGVGGFLSIVQTIQAAGKRPDTNDVIAERLARAEEMIAKLQASPVAQPDAPPVPA